MRTEGYDPRHLVKEYATVYRESEERRIDWENYHHWLYCVRNNDNKKVENKVDTNKTCVIE